MVLALWVHTVQHQCLRGLTEVRLLSQAQGLHIPFITSFITNMRKIEREMIQAIIDGRDWKKANTEVITSPAYARVYLHDNCIAEYSYCKDCKLSINHCGWKTVTTKSRLNALIKFVLGDLVGINQTGFEWYLNSTKLIQTNPDIWERKVTPIPDGWLLV